MNERKENIRTIAAIVTAAATCATFVLLLVVTLIIVPQVSRALSQASSGIDSIVSMSDDLTTTLQDVDELISSTSTLVEQNTQGMEEALSHFNEINFDDLNKAISDLSDVVEPLANFSNAFR